MAGGFTCLTGSWGLEVAASIVVGYGLGFLFVDQADPPWEMIAALAMLLPMGFAGILPSLAALVVRMRASYSVFHP